MSESNVAPVAKPQVVKPPTDLEKLEMDRLRLERELKELQKELEDTLRMNDDMLSDLKNKDEYMMTQEAYLKVLSEKNAAELQQLDMEHVCLREQYAHNIEAAEREDTRLKFQRERFVNLEQENHELTQALAELMEITATASLEHANSIHEMNRGMGDFRKSLEEKMRVDLVTIEATYQSNAFLSLSESEKEQIFDNTKLKDEVILQGVGLANLSLRLRKQEVGTEQCRKEQRELHRTAYHLRNKLSDLQLTKMSRNHMRGVLTAELGSIQKRVEALLSQANALPPADELEASLRQYRADTTLEEQQRVMWLLRQELVHELNREVQPVTEHEKQGYYSSATFRIEQGARPDTGTRPGTAGGENLEWDDSLKASGPTANVGRASIASAGTAGTRDSDAESGGSASVAGLKLSLLEKATTRDPTLALALAPIKGQESLCITRPEQLPLGQSGEDGTGKQAESVNVVGWIAQMLMEIWASTESSAVTVSTATATATASSGFMMQQMQQEVGALGLGDSWSQGLDFEPGSIVAAGSDDVAVAGCLNVDVDVDEGNEGEGRDTAEALGTEREGSQGREGGDISPPPSPSDNADNAWDPATAELLIALEQDIDPGYGFTCADTGPASRSSQHSPRESREEIERLWDEAFTLPPGPGGRNGSQQFQKGQGQGRGREEDADSRDSFWFRKPTVSHRLPQGVTGVSAEPKLFLFDHIRPLATSFDVGPPIALGIKPTSSPDIKGRVPSREGTAPGAMHSRSLSLSHSLSHSSSSSIAGPGGSTLLSGQNLAAALRRVSASASQENKLKAPGSAYHAQDQQQQQQGGPKPPRKGSLRMAANLMFSSSGVPLQRVKSAPALEAPGAGKGAGKALLLLPRKLRGNPSASALGK